MQTEPSPAPAGLKLRLAGMMFLQYAIWGAWLPLLFPFLNEHRGLSASQVGNLAALGAVGALAAPFLAGQIADRWLAQERLLAICHLLGAVLVWQLAELKNYSALLVFSLLYALVYAPTLAITNAIAFRHLPDRDRDFGKVRVWGTIGWIAAGIGIGQWLLHRHTPAALGPADLTAAGKAAVRAAQVAGMADAFRLSALLGAVLGLGSLVLPHTPPARGRKRFAPAEALAEVGRRKALVVLFLTAFPVSVIHQFYFVHTSTFLGRLDMDAPLIDRIFGVGGGGLMTLGQMSEILVLALIPLIAKRVSRKTLLAAGLAAYFLRFAVFAWLPQPAAVLPGLALHGVCFGCFIFVAFMIVDEETSGDVRASAQSLFNFIVVGLGVIAGNVFAGLLGDEARLADGFDYALLFGIPAWIALACLILFLGFYPRGRPAPGRPA